MSHKPRYQIRSVYRALIRHLILSLMLVGGAVLVVNFTSQNIVRISEGLTAARSKAEAEARKAQMSAELKAAFLAVGDSDQQIVSAFLPVDNILDFVTLLETLATETVVEQKIQMGTPTPTGLMIGDSSISTVDYSLLLTGDVAALESYLKKLERSPYITAMRSIALNSSQLDGWNGASAITLQGTIYVR